MHNTNKVTRHLRVAVVILVPILMAILDLGGKRSLKLNFISFNGLLIPKNIYLEPNFIALSAIVTKLLEI